MTRKRVLMELITHEPTRLAVFKKRKACVMKKAMELSVLCNIPVYVEVSYGVNSVPEIWPPSKEDASAIINRFESMSESEQTKKMVDKDGFVSQQIGKKQLQLQKVLQENQDLEDRLLLKKLLKGECSLADVRDREVLGRLQALMEKQEREKLKLKEQQVSASSSVPVQSDAGCGTSSMTAVMPVPDKNSSPFMVESVQEGGFLDSFLLPDGGEEIQFQMPLLTANSEEIFDSSLISLADKTEDLIDSLQDWGSVEKEIAESFDNSHEKVPNFESNSVVVVPEEEKLDEFFDFSDDLLALPDWFKNGEELPVPDWSTADEDMMRMFDQFGNNQEMMDILSSC